jgi:hypothetical protein
MTLLAGLSALLAASVRERWLAVALLGLGIVSVASVVVALLNA